jgi:hypothetical protein
VELEEILPGIDLVYSARGRELELTWVVAAGSDPRRIHLEFEGVEGIEIDPSGELVLSHAGIELRLKKPRLFQDGLDGPREVRGGYRLGGARQVGFRIGEYDTRRTLVIDPILSYSTYLGGNDADLAQAIAADRKGNVYVAGQSLSPPAPLVDGTLAPDGMLVAYVAKLDALGTLEYSTFVGGTDPPAPEELAFDAMALAVDGAGFVYLTGDTSSPDFPTVNAPQPRHRGGHDAFALKLGPAGSPLVYSTYLGGSNEDFGRGLAVDAAGNLLLTGITLSSDFPAVAALQPQLGGARDAFLAKLDPAGSTLLFSTYLGGSDGPGAESFGDLGHALAVDASGNAYLGGYTASRDFPTANPLQPSFAGGTHDAFVSKVAADGSALLYSTYLGGTGDEECLSIAADEFGSVTVTGWTSSLDFPSSSGRPHAGALDAFVTRLSADGKELVYSTPLGGGGFDFAHGVALGERGEAHVIGVSGSPDFPVTAAVQPLYGGGSTDAFVTGLSADGSTLRYSTFLGGSGSESHFYTSLGIALSGREQAFVAGTTDSVDFPVIEPIQGEIRGAVDGFVAKIGYGPEVRVSLEPHGGNDLLRVQLDNGGTSPRNVELKLFVALGPTKLPLYPRGVVTRLDPSERRRLPEYALPGLQSFPGFEVRALLLDPATGEILSESSCSTSPCR